MKALPEVRAVLRLGGLMRVFISLTNTEDFTLEHGAGISRIGWPLLADLIEWSHKVGCYHQLRIYDAAKRRIRMHSIRDRNLTEEEASAQYPFP